jgi:acetyltransferase-like isoleucine patch superfamily enzyme
MIMSRSSIPCSTYDLCEAQRRLREFCKNESEERLFTHPIDHPALPTGFCYCEKSFFTAALFLLKAVIISAIFKLPFSTLKGWILRRFGAKIGKNVFFSEGVWVDPTFPELITIEDKVLLGMHAKIFNHECRIDEFRAGKVIIRSGAFIGGFAVLAPGVEIGENAVVSAFAVAAHDVPPGATLVAAPSRLIKHSNGDNTKSSKESGR